MSAFLHSSAVTDFAVHQHELPGRGDRLVEALRAAVDEHRARGHTLAEARAHVLATADLILWSF
jgi:hypothetical protein